MKNIDYTERYSGSPLCLSVLYESPGRKCQLCQKTFKSSSSETWQQHIDSAKHKKNESTLLRKSLSPSKKVGGSPQKNEKKLLLEEKQALELVAKNQKNKAAQLFYDIGVMYSAQGSAAKGRKCLEQCLALLPPINEKTGVARLMIEVKARMIICRMAWGKENSEDFLFQCSRLFHATGAAAPRMQDIMDWRTMKEKVDTWVSGCRKDDVLEKQRMEFCEEFGCRLCSHVSSLDGAVLLLCAKSYQHAFTVFNDLELFGHAAHCLFLYDHEKAQKGSRYRNCVRFCIIHENPMMLRKCLDSMDEKDELWNVVDAVVNFDVSKLEKLSALTEGEGAKKIARDALAKFK